MGIRKRLPLEPGIRVVVLMADLTDKGEEIRRAPINMHPYCRPPGIWRRFRAKIRERDQWRCPVCGNWWQWMFFSYEESWWEWQLVGTEPSRG
jgi:hypothetical protein